MPPAAGRFQIHHRVAARDRRQSLGGVDGAAHGRGRTRARRCRRQPGRCAPRSRRAHAETLARYWIPDPAGRRARRRSRRRGSGDPHDRGRGPPAIGRHATRSQRVHPSRAVGRRPTDSIARGRRTRRSARRAVDRGAGGGGHPLRRRARAHRRARRRLRPRRRHVRHRCPATHRYRLRGGRRARWRRAHRRRELRPSAVPLLRFVPRRDVTRVVGPVAHQRRPQVEACAHSIC